MTTDLLIVTLLVLVILLLISVLLVQMRLRRDIKRREHFNFEHYFNGSIWPQTEGLISIYRVLDGKFQLPVTRGWAASPDFLLHVIHHIQQSAPKVIVECGSGTSTVMMAALLRVLKQQGHIYSLENHPHYAEQVRSNLRSQGLDSFVTVITAPLSMRSYGGFEHGFNWYEFQPESVPGNIDLLIVDGPYGGVNQHARYPAGPELFPKLNRPAHVFLDDAHRKDEADLPGLWQALYPDLGTRELSAEKGAIELFFLDPKSR